MNLFTIGFTKKPARTFFNLLITNKVKNLIDVRLNNVNQLAGFSKKEDLKYFLESIGKIGYIHMTELAPTQPMLDAYKKNGGAWDIYEKAYLDLLEQREIEKKIPAETFENGCLLCSEEKPHHCHRRLAAEYISKKYKTGVSIVHL